ncbi:MAG: DUF2283 domain-containing protein [Candidatus Pacebacteria bacterium]|nr:DUF2283 domain-containing protein [Candidatus Paceibacterota bacterium]
MAPQIKYDKNSNIVSIRVSDEKSVDSDVKNNVVVDYDKNGQIVNIDIMKIGIGEFKKILKTTSLKGAVNL